jgi:hypothetical protein
MNAVQKVAIEKAISFLEAAGAEYRIVSPDGKSYGTLKLSRKKSKVFVNKRGTFSAIYKDVIDNAKVGDVVQVPYAKLGSDDKRLKSGLRSSASAYASTKWGKGTYTSTVANGVIEFLRTN